MALFIALSEERVGGGWVTFVVVVVQDSHCIDGEEAHVLGYHEGGVAEVVLVAEDESVLQLLFCPFHVAWVSLLVLGS